MLQLLRTSYFLTMTYKKDSLFFILIFIYFIIIIIIILLFRAIPMAYGGSQARGCIGVVAAGLHHSSQQCQILYPLSEARYRTGNLMVPTQIRFRCTMMRTPPTLPIL